MTDQRWNRQKEEAFLQVLQQTGNVSSAAAGAGLDRSLVYRRRNSNATFRAKWHLAMDQALDDLEAYLWDKAMGKTRLRPSDKGEEAARSVIDEKAAIFLLKAHRPEIFGNAKKRPGMKNSRRVASPRDRLLKKIDQMAENTRSGE